MAVKKTLVAAILRMVFVVSLLSPILNVKAADVLYEADFSTFNNGLLGGQDGWEAQNDWMVSNGLATNAGSWTRARQLTAFPLSPDNSVRMTAEFSLTGSAGNSELLRIGFAKTNEHTGANMPQVFAGVTWTGSQLTVGDATISNYDSGETVMAEVTFKMLPQSDTWERTTVLTNLTDPETDTATDTIGDSAGTVSPETAWAWLNSGGSAYFGLRSFDNPNSVAIGISSVLFENNLSSVQVATPNILSSTSGQIAAGELGDVVDSDDQYLEYYPDLPGQGNPFPISLEFSTFLGDMPSSELNLTFESGSNTPGLTQILEVLNWGTGQFEIVQSGASDVSDATVSISLSNSINSFVNGPNNEIKIRSRWVSTSPVIFYPWKIRVDQVVFEFQ